MSDLLKISVKKQKFLKATIEENKLLITALKKREIVNKTIMFIENRKHEARGDICLSKLQKIDISNMIDEMQKSLDIYYSRWHMEVEYYTLKERD